MGRPGSRPGSRRSTGRRSARSRRSVRSKRNSQRGKKVMVRIQIQKIFIDKNWFTANQW